MAESHESRPQAARAVSQVEEEDEDGDESQLLQLSPRERAAKAAAAAQARASGQSAPPAEAVVAESIAHTSGVQLDQATAALAAATLSPAVTSGAGGVNDLVKSLSEQLECCERAVYSDAYSVL